MKPYHHVLATLVSSLALTTVLSAATLPQIKTAPSKSPAALQTVKVPPVVRAPTAPKVPNLANVAAPKVIAAPKVAALPKGSKQPRPSVPPCRLGLMPGSTKVTNVIAGPKIVPAKLPAAAAAPKVKAGTSINTRRLDHLKEAVQIDSSKFVQAGDQGGRLLKDHLGGSATKRPGSLLGGLKGGASQHDRNPLSSNPAKGMRGDQNSLVSDAGRGRSDASKPSRNHEFTTTVKNKDGSESTHYSDGTELRFYPNGTAVYVDEKGKEHVMPGMSVAAPFIPNKPLTSPSGSSTKTPTPEGETSGGSGVITMDTLRGIQAKKNQASEPAQDESTGTGGPLNTGASGTGRHGSLSQPVSGATGKEGVSLGAALETVRVKIESRINNGR